MFSKNTEELKNFETVRDYILSRDNINAYKSEYRNLSCGIVAIHSGWKI